MTKIHPAIAEHAMHDNAQLRARITALEAQLAALPQKTEPVPAQDERDAFEAWRLEHFCGGVDRLRKCSNAPEVYYYTAEQEAWKVWQARAALARPAQTEQQPVSWQFYQNGKWWNGDDRIKDHRKNTEAVGIPVRDLYAAPIAQTAPQPEQSGLVEAAQGALVEIQAALEDAYINAYPECCGQAHLECCGSSVQAWSEADQKTMERFAPHERALRAALSAVTAERDRLREAVELLSRLRDLINCTPENDVDKVPVWISTKHPTVERIDALLAAMAAKEE